MMKSELQNPEVHLGQVFAQSQQNAEQLEHLGQKLDTAIGELRRAIETTAERSERLIEQVRRTTAPNLGNIWAGIGVGISFVAICGAAFGFGVNREINRLDQSFEKLDSKLQREQALTVDNVSQQVRQVGARVDGIESRNWQQIHDDLQELRQRRYNAH